VAHQWWFGVVGNNQIDEPWLDEALTQYSTMLYYEKAYGPKRAAGILRGEFIQTHQSLVRRGRDMPAGLSAAAYGPELYWQVVYDKGTLYFHELRTAVGDEAFFEILQTYYSRQPVQDRHARVLPGGRRERDRRPASGRLLVDLPI
jgi:aminopeptidase N